MIFLCASNADFNVSIFKTAKEEMPRKRLLKKINSATPLFDMSLVYGSTRNTSLQKGRKFEGGLLKYEIYNGQVWPPSTNTQINLCLLNQKPYESRCHDTPDDGTNSLIGLNLCTIWFWRQHNHIATVLSELNPCWADEELFQYARDINLAIALQIFYYELLPAFLGYQNLITSNVISSSPGFRDVYNENVIPQVSLEYPYGLRWIHTMQEGNLRLYDENGYFLKNFPLVNLTLRTGFLAVDNNLAYITHGSFRQASGKIDYIVDPDMAEIGLGPHQRMSDILTNDLAKNRYFGFPPYVKYREFCFGRSYDSFEDLSDIIDPERIEKLKELYEDVEDIDMLAGLWVERKIEGGFVPPTLYCLMVDQLVRNVVSDRHWYERPNRPNAFTFDQLQEIRKASIARLLCDVGDNVSEIQPRAFLRAGPGNEVCSCDTIDNINLEQWKDFTCGSQVK